MFVCGQDWRGMFVSVTTAVAGTCDWAAWARARQHNTLKSGLCSIRVTVCMCDLSRDSQKAPPP